MNLMNTVLHKISRGTKKVVSPLQFVSCPVCRSIRTHYFVFNRPFDLYKCRSCETYFVYPEVEVSVLEEIYDEAYLHENRRSIFVEDMKDESQWHVWKSIREGFLLSLELAAYEKDHQNKSLKVLEVGCAEGRQLEIFKKRGWETIGLEINEYAVQYGRNNLGLKIFHGTEISDVPVSELPVDCVIMSHTIEHVIHPLEVMKSCYNCLNPGGMIFLETPVPPHFYYDPCHLFLFNEKSLRILLKEAGFIDQEHIMVNHPDKFQNIVIKGVKPLSPCIE